MNHPIPKPDQYQDMREALRDLCGSFDSAYWQKVDHERAYPEAFVDAMAQAGWLAALIALVWQMNWVPWSGWTYNAMLWIMLGLMDGAQRLVTRSER